MGAYRLVRKLATGGMAEVFLAKVVGLDGFEKPVAVKRILPHLSEDPIFVSLFLQEAKLTVTLQHANVVQVFDLGALRGQYYMVLEFIDGENLRSLLTAAGQRGVQVGVREACYITQQVAEGLAYAHERKDPSGRPLNIVHRDVNPTNVMINRTGEVKLADFGIAKASGSQSNTGSGTIKAKTGYMAPEQAAGEEPDQRSDVFLLGLLLYELLAGKRLFGETDLIKSIKQIAFFDPKALLPLPGVPGALWEIVLRSLSPHAATRTPSAREFGDQLNTFLFDNRLKVGTKDIAAFFARAMPSFRSPLEVQGNESGEEIRLTSSAEPSPHPARPEPTPPPVTPAPATPSRAAARPSYPSRPGPAARPAAPEPLAPVAADSSIKIDRRSQGVVLALLGEGKLSQGQLPDIASLQATLGCDFLTALQRSGLVPEEDVVMAQAEVLRVPYVSLARLESMPVPKDAIKLVNRAQAERLGVVPMAVRGAQLFVATADASNLPALDELKFISGKGAVVPILATSEGLDRARTRFYGGQFGGGQGIEVAGWGGSTGSGSMDLELGEDGTLGPAGRAAPQRSAPAARSSPQVGSMDLELGEDGSLGPSIPAPSIPAPAARAAPQRSAAPARGQAPARAMELSADGTLSPAGHAAPPGPAPRAASSFELNPDDARSVASLAALMSPAASRPAAPPARPSRAALQRPAPAPAAAPAPIAVRVPTPTPAPTPAAPIAARVPTPLPQASLVISENDPGTSRVQQRLLTSLFALSGSPLTLAPAFITLAQRLSERLGASAIELERVAAAGAALAVASRLEGREPYAVPGTATLRAVLGAAYDDIADLLEPAVNLPPGRLAPGPGGLAAALRFASKAGTPTPDFEGAKAAIVALREELPEEPLSVLGEELSDRYVKKPRVLVALRDASLLADVSRLLTNQGFASCSVRTRAELDQQLLGGAATLLAEPTFSELGTPEAIAGLRSDPKLTDLPIVLVASAAQTGLANLGIEAGADDVFSLPFNEAMVVSKLKRLAERQSA